MKNMSVCCFRSYNPLSSNYTLQSVKLSIEHTPILQFTVSMPVSIYQIFCLGEAFMEVR